MVSNGKLSESWDLVHEGTLPPLHIEQYFGEIKNVFFLRTSFSLKIQNA